MGVDRRGHRRWSRSGSVGVVAAALGVACTSAARPADEVPGAYAVVISWFAARAPAESERPVVFVEPQGEGFEIGLDLQAGVIAATESEAEVQFIDDRSEAVDDDGGIREDGLLLAIGPAVIDGDDAVLTASELDGADGVETWRFELSFDDDRWLLVAPPTNDP